MLQVESDGDGEVKNRVELAISKVTSAVHTFVDVYCNSFETNFSLSQAVIRGMWMSLPSAFVINGR